MLKTICFKRLSKVDYRAWLRAKSAEFNLLQQAKSDMEVAEGRRQLREAYKQSQAFKLGFLRSTAHYKHCSDASLDRVARTMRRRVHAAGTTLVREGETADKVFFCVAGKLQVTQAGGSLAVLGASSCFGDRRVSATGRMHRVAS